MMSSYLDWTLLTLRKRCWKKRWVGRSRRKNLGIHWNSLSTAGRGVISREGLKQAISGAAPPRPLIQIESCISKPFSTSDHLSQCTTAQDTCPVPIRVCGFESWLLLTDEGCEKGGSLSCSEWGENGCTGWCPWIFLVCYCAVVGVSSIPSRMIWWWKWWGTVPTSSSRPNCCKFNNDVKSNGIWE